MSIDTLTKLADRTVSSKLPAENSEEFEARCAEALRKVASKYAWTAQHQGVVLRRNPLKQPPYRDYIYNRIAKAEYGFHYVNEQGKKRFWYPDFEEVFGLTLEGEVDHGLLIAERVEFLPARMRSLTTRMDVAYSTSGDHLHGLTKAALHQPSSLTTSATSSGQTLLPSSMYSTFWAISCSARGSVLVTHS